MSLVTVSAQGPHRDPPYYHRVGGSPPRGATPNLFLRKFIVVRVYCTHAASFPMGLPSAFVYRDLRL